MFRGLVFALLSVLTHVAFAQEISATRGQQIATTGIAGVTACISCHGLRGEGGVSFPRLAGTGAQYLQAQLDAFAAGTRKSSIMQPLAGKLAQADRASVALYFSRLAPPFTAHDRPSASPEDGAWLATRGRWSQAIPACTQCHGPGGNGVGEHFPPLAGLPVAYIEAQLQSWKAATRPAGPMELMQAVALKLSDADVLAVSSYFAGLASPGEATAVPPAAPAPSAAGVKK